MCLKIKINPIIVAKDINYMKTDFLINFLKKLHPPTINLHFYQYFLLTMGVYYVYVYHLSIISITPYRRGTVALA